MTNSKFKLYLAEVRAPFFTATIVPVLLGSVIAWSSFDMFSWSYFGLTLFGSILIQAAANVINDYWDHKSGNDEVNVEFLRPYTGGSRMIQKGLLSPNEVLVEAIILFAGGIVIGLFLTYMKGDGILYLGLVGVLSAYFYTAPPFKLVFRGIGELFIGLDFGILLTVGAFYVQTGFFALEPLIASLPIALLVTAILYINEFQDYKADKKVGKNHLVARMGKKRAQVGYGIMMWTTYISIVAGVVAQIISPWTLLGLITIPIAMKAVNTAKVHYDDYLKLAPANVGTIMSHLLTGLLMSIGYLIDRWVS